MYAATFYPEFPRALSAPWREPMRFRDGRELYFTRMGHTCPSLIRKESMNYNLKFSESEQIGLEEQIAAILFDYTYDHEGGESRPSEETCQSLSKQILAAAVARLRPDLLEPQPEQESASAKSNQSECANCGTRYADDELTEIRDYFQRVVPGDTVPSGQCPDETCGALCFPVNCFH
jgi:hypothetical protein